ncbi:MAG: aminoacyl-tRNA hydrolase [Ruminococcaceae bacterium]|nr:aminoacyl-tRNA hydrolase [Oscillospiraceae bacterium]
MSFLLFKNNIEWLIVCLGNPGEKYTFTRHNAGFLTADYISQKENISINKLKFKALCGEMKIGNTRALIMKPQTFMNLSGEAVSAAASFYKIPPEKVLVVFDDVELDVGKMRIRRNGSAGGHNGIKSIILNLNSDNFPRVKIGVGKKPSPEYDLANWVLGKIPKADQKALYEVIEKSADAVKLIVEGDISGAMNKFN